MSVTDRTYRILSGLNVFSVQAPSAIEAVQRLKNPLAWCEDTRLYIDTGVYSWVVQCPNSGETFKVYQEGTTGPLTLASPFDEELAEE